MLYIYICLLQMHSCGYCQQTFAIKSQLMEHHRLNKHLNTFTCGVCQKRFTRKENIDKQERKHNNDSFFPCNECGLLYRRKDNLHHHLKEKRQSGAGLQNQPVDINHPISITLLLRRRERRCLDLTPNPTSTELRSMN